MKKIKNWENVERLYNKYVRANVKELSDEMLDWQIVELGRQCLEEPTEGLRELLENRKYERWLRKAKQPLEADLEEMNEKFRRFVKAVYDDTLDTAQSVKRELEADSEAEGRQMVVESQLFVESFASDANKFCDEENDLPGLMDILMDAETLINSNFLAITFILVKGQEIHGPTFDELFQPSQRDGAWNYLLDNDMQHLPASRLCYPLRKLYLEYSVALQDILSIRRFDFCTEQWQSRATSFDIEND